jgi:hypothetical protein
MPVIRRSAIPDNVVFRAFLSQPIIRYFHHGRFSGAMESPLAAAADINALGDVHWMSLGEIARSNYACRCEGNLLVVRPFSRRILVAIPHGVSTLQVDTSLVRAEGMLLVVGGSRPVDVNGLSETYSVSPGSPVDIALHHGGPVSYQAGVSRRTPFAALVHRRLGEALDRMKVRRG